MCCGQCGGVDIDYSGGSGVRCNSKYGSLIDKSVEDAKVFFLNKVFF